MRSRTYPREFRNKNYCRRSAILVWTICSSIVLIGFTALAVDIGYTYHVKAQLQRTADAAAMAAASKFVELTEDGNDTELRQTAEAYAQKNKIGCLQPTLADTDIVLGRTVPEDDGKCTFLEGAEPYDAVKITVRLTKDSPNGPVNLFFGSVLGAPTAELSASAIATLVPRDIAIVVDLSNSMSYDSQLRHENSTNINIKQVWEDLGSPLFGNMKVFHDKYSDIQPITKNSINEIKQALGLTANIGFPSNKGSWDDYIRYVRGDKSFNNADKILNDINNKYVNRYSLRTLVQYLLDCRSQASDMPALSKCHVQPVTALKDAVEELCNILMLMDSGDLVTLVIYSNTGDVKVQLTNNYLEIIEAARGLQAGQNGNSTNIANGIERARQELKSTRSRPAAKKVMIVMTDGKANLPANNSSLQAINAGHSAVNQGIQIYTISLGTESDQELMKQLSDLGGGVHFHVPTFDIEQYEEDLKRIYRSLGGKRPIRLIQ